MKKEVVIKRTENFVKKILGNEGTGHDFWHIERVRNNAKLINKTEKGDWIVIELAVLLHDIGDWKVIGKDEDDYSIAENFLKSQKISIHHFYEKLLLLKDLMDTKTGKKIASNRDKFMREYLKQFFKEWQGKA